MCLNELWACGSGSTVGLWVLAGSLALSHKAVGNVGSVSAGNDLGGSRLLSEQTSDRGQGGWQKPEGICC